MLRLVVLVVLCSLAGCGSENPEIDRLVTSNRELRNSVTILGDEVSGLKNELELARKSKALSEIGRRAPEMKADEVQKYATGWQQGDADEKRALHQLQLFGTKEQVLTRFGRPVRIQQQDSGERWIWQGPENAFFLWITFSDQGYVTDVLAGTN